jgi:predicted Holliday junction resolvase-like endonuclease
VPEVTFFIAGLILGIVLVMTLLRESLKSRYERSLDQWKDREIKAIRSDALARSRAGLKGRIGEQLAPLLVEFAYAPADARFLGNPIDYVIFDGYTEVKERQADQLRRIVFLDVKKGPSASLSYEELRIRDCIERTREIHFETLHLGDVPDSED